MRAAIYCRISMDATGEQLGVTRQLEDCEAMARELDWPVAEVYVDNDVSATSGKARPAYQKMLADIQAGRIDAIVAWHADRLYRRMVDLQELLDVVRAAGTQIATVKAGRIDLTTDSGQMIAEILASVSSYEGRAKSTRWKRSIRQRREAGNVHTMGPRLYGYERDGSIVPHEREHIEWAAEQILDGAALIRTTIGLNERGARTTMGNEWNRAGLRKLLTNPRLAGMSTLNGDVVGVGQWSGIFDAETFESIQAALSVRKGTVPARPRVALLLGLIKCGRCGKPLKSGRRASKNGIQGKRTYRCGTLPGPDQGCGGLLVDAESVEEVVESYAQAKANDPRVRAYIDELSAKSGERAGEALSLEARIRELEDQLGEPGVPVAAILRAIDRSKERLEEIRAQSFDASPTFTAGAEWPDDLARRARAVRNVVAEVIIAPAERGWVFDPARVEIVPRG